MSSKDVNNYKYFGISSRYVCVGIVGWKVKDLGLVENCSDDTDQIGAIKYANDIIGREATEEELKDINSYTDDT